jgi:hypothetical protein
LCIAQRKNVNITAFSAIPSILPISFMATVPAVATSTGAFITKKRIRTAHLTVASPLTILPNVPIPPICAKLPISTKVLNRQVQGLRQRMLLLVQ